MKSASLFLFILMLLACNKQPVLVDERKVIYLDESTKSDTIIVSYNLQYNSLNPEIYYAEKHWQANISPNPVKGFRFIGIRNEDTIYLTTNSNYNYEKYFLKFSIEGDQLLSQKFLLPPSSSNVRSYIRLN